MNGLGGFPLDFKFGTFFQITAVAAALSLSACGGDHSVSPISVATNTSNDTQGTQLSQTRSGSLQVHTTPALKPSFDPSIHDYVINCTSSSEIQFSASLGGPGYFSFFGPGEAGTRPGALPFGSFQKSLPMMPNQRFRFVVDQSGSEYSVRCLPHDFPPLTAAVTGTPQAQYYLFAPTLSLQKGTVTTSYVIIVDANGTPIWWKDSAYSTGPIDAKVLGPNEIAWSYMSGQYAGSYIVRDFAGRILNRLTGGLDIHDLQPTPDGTFLAIHEVARICPPDCADMSPWGGDKQAAVIDAEIREVDSNSNVLWTWRTRDHIALSETGLSGWFPSAGDDIIHMNALQPDGTDAVIFSARHLSAIYRIIKSTGAIDWKIGGVTRAESLVVLGDTRPTAVGAGAQVLSGQHDVRLWSDGTISVHDNGTIAGRSPFVNRYQVDTAARTAQLVEQFQDSRYTFSFCCGSARRLPAGHWLVQWGAAPFLTELDQHYNPVLTIDYNVGTGYAAQFSYRAFPILPGMVVASVLRDGMDAIQPGSP